jgi:uncharacterized protein with PIN domain
MEPRFIVDVNVGRLATWLRIMGYDAVFQDPIEDNDLVRVALREGRVIVTRDGGLAERRLAATGRIKVVLVRDDEIRRQIDQVRGELNLDGRNGFSRCVRCNEPLGPRSRQSVEGLVPPYVYRTQDAFMECPVCGRVYWRGTHWDNMRKELGLLRSGDP